MTGPADIILSTERMRTIEAVDPIQRTAIVQSGVVLQALHEAVEAQDLFFPLDLGARGTCTLGGMASTNAGGNRVLRYGMMRDMILGMEVVLADGTVVSSMAPFIKNNTGYDLKHLFIGAEGTLGVITRLVLRLREKPLASQTALVALENFDAVAALLRHMDRSLGGALSSFEVMWRSYYELVTPPPAKGRAPLTGNHAFYVLLETQGNARERDAANFEEALGIAMEEELVADAVIARSDAETRRLWAIRDDVEQLGRNGYPVGFDISLPISQMQDYLSEVDSRLAGLNVATWPYVFGHLGDGNLHVVVAVPREAAGLAKSQVEKAVYEPLQIRGGSISAEHGIGLDKRAWLPVSRSPAELAVMRAIKRALDPQNRINPGKLL
ncbi:FAD-binding oxidoreductase [Rhodopseudomonas palustris]